MVKIDFTLIPRIENLKEKILVGDRMKMSLAADKTGALWYSFMLKRKAIKNNIGTVLYSIQNYDDSYFINFNLNTEFEKWAVIEVSDPYNVPDGMEIFTLPEGLYAVFFYKGDVGMGGEIFRQIFEIWLPDSDYILDKRPHFEVLGKNYKNSSQDSEEEIWIPVQPKN